LYSVSTRPVGWEEGSRCDGRDGCDGCEGCRVGAVKTRRGPGSGAALTGRGSSMVSSVRACQEDAAFPDRWFRVPGMATSRFGKTGGLVAAVVRGRTESDAWNLGPGFWECRRLEWRGLVDSGPSPLTNSTSSLFTEEGSAVSETWQAMSASSSRSLSLLKNAVQ